MTETLGYQPGEPFPGVIGRTVEESTAAWPVAPTARAGAPNIVLVVLDDVGFAQPSAFGGGCEMPTLDGLAERGLRFTNFHATPLCSPTRACILTGRNHHTVGMGSLTELSMGFPGYNAMAGPQFAFLPAILRQAGYNTFAVGKWHLTPPAETSSAGPFRFWPLGRGFERYYGFMGGDSSQWFPDLVQDNVPIPPPATPGEGYHLNADLADRAIEMIKSAHVAEPNKPFFLYYALGAGHAPHHVEPEWRERYQGRFDHGWDDYRTEVFDRQVRSGIFPDGTKLSVRDADVPSWGDLSADARRMFARQMETYAGFLSQTDHHVGRVLDYIARLGELDNTIVVVMSDNGASAEGGPEGTFNEGLFFNLIPERLEDNLKHFDGWGGVDTFPHYAWGWAWAGTTPFRRWKRETYRGGVSEPLIVSWPAGISAGHNGGLRRQYAHAIDVLPTLLDAAGVDLPETVDGVPQEPFHGVSVAASFEAPDSDVGRSVQYFEMMGYRALYADGYRAVCGFPRPTLKEAADQGQDFRFTSLTPELLEELDGRWELFDVENDPAESVNLAEAEPERVAKMVELWYSEAERYGVLPIASPAGRRIAGPRRRSDVRRTVYRFDAGAAPLPFTIAPRLAGRGHSITAQVTVPDGVSGVLLAQGGRFGGYALFAVDGRIHHVHAYGGLERMTVTTAEPLAAGDHTIRYEFEPVGAPVELFAGKGVPARSKIYVDGVLAAAKLLPYTLAASFGFSGVTCGYAMPDSVDPDVWDAPFVFTGTIDEVLLDVSGELTIDPDVELNALLAHQ